MSEDKEKKTTAPTAPDTVVKQTTEQPKPKVVEPVYFRTVGKGTVTILGVRFTRDQYIPVTDPALMKKCKRHPRIEQQVDNEPEE